MKLTFVVVAAVCLAFLNSGCATIVNGSSQGVVIDSSPSGARVEVGGATRGTTPTTVTLEKKSNLPIVVSKDGYRSATIVPTKSMDSWFWGNIILGGFFGSTTDGVSGSVNKFDPGSYFVTLEPEQGAARKEGGVFLIQDDEAQVKQFILASYAPLSANIASGAGPYLDTLLQKTKIPKEQYGEATKQLKALLVAFPNIIDFSDGTLKVLKALKSAEK